MKNENWKTKYHALINALKSVCDNMGIYPAAVKCYNNEKDYEQRTEFQNGWNSAVMKYGAALGKVIDSAVGEVDSNLQILLSSDYCYFMDEKLFISMNDTWAWACADAEEIPKENINEVAVLFRKYGWCGLLYWASKRNNNAKSEFKDINRFIEFVENEERLIKEEPSSSKRAYKKYKYTLGNE